MSARSRIVATAAALLLAGAGVGLGLSTGTSTAAATEIAVDPETLVSAVFAEPWVLELVITETGSGFAPVVDETTGTVDIFIEQLPGVFLEDLVVQADGRVFVSQPPDLPWLAPGTYTVRAQFSPTPNTGLEAAQVVVAEAITIAPIELVAQAEVVTASTENDVPTVALSLGGVEGSDTPLASAPPGVWTVSVTEAESGETVVTREVAQSTEIEPVVVELGDTLRPGVDHVLTAEYVPVEEFAPGVVVTGLSEQSFRTPDGGLGEALLAPVAVPVWALIGIALGILLGAIGLVVALRSRHRRSPGPDAHPSIPTSDDEPGEPDRSALDDDPASTDNAAPSDDSDDEESPRES